MYTIHGIIMNLGKYKALMGTGNEELVNAQTANYCVGRVKWWCPLFRTRAWSGWQIYGAEAHTHSIDNNVFEDIATKNSYTSGKGEKCVHSNTARRYFYASLTLVLMSVGVKSL